MKDCIARLAAIVVAVMLGLSARAAVAESALSFAIVPQFPALDIHRTWSPIAKALEVSLGQPVQLKMYPSIPEFEKDFLAGGPDLLYLNPYHMVLAQRARGYLPLVRDSAEQLAGILVVQAASKITMLNELQGVQIAFPAPNSFGASLLLRALLADQYRLDITPKYVQTHGNAYRYVARGEVAAAGGIRATLEREPEDLRNRLRILYETPSFPSHPVAAHPRLKPEMREKITRALFKIAETAEGRQWLATVELTAPVVADYRRDYAPLEKLNLDRHMVIPK
jgi:phosphonate transport system substrate-binding protein